MKKIILPIACLVVFGACKNEVKKAEEILRPIKYITLGKSVNGSSRTFNGDVRASKKIELSFRSSGVITQLNANVGQKIKQGELIASLDNVQATLAYDQAVSALNTAKASLENAKIQLDRTRSLYEKGTNSLSDYEQAKISYKKSQDQFENAKGNLDIKKSQINYGRIYAPANGVIASKSVNINETANSGQVIAVLNAGNLLNIEVGIPENVINSVQLAMPVNLKFSAYKGQNFTGYVSEIAPIVDPNSSTYLVKVVIKDNIENLKQGMSAKVSFQFGQKQNELAGNVLVIPLSTVGEDGTGNFVFLVDSVDPGKGQVKKQYITLGKLTNDGFIIEDGLSEGQHLVTAGINSLLDGQNVKL